MKRLVLLFIIFLIAVAVAPLLINEKGYVLIAMGNTTVESTVVTAIIGLIVLFLGLLISLRIIGGGMRFGKGTWHKVVFAGRRKAQRDFNKGVAAYVLNDYKQAEHLLVKAAGHQELSQASYLLAASACNQLALPENIKHYLSELALETTEKKALSIDTIVVAITLYFQQQDYIAARKLLDDYHKHIGHDARLLRLEIALSLKENRYLHAVEMLNLARKNKEIADQQITVWEKDAFYGAFTQQLKEHDSKQLHQYWNNLARKIKQRDEVAYAYMLVLAENNLSSELEDLIAPLLKKDTEDGLLKRLRHLPISHTNKLLPLVQKHLQKQPQSAKWLSFLAHLAYNSQQWDMAEKAFNSLMKLPEQAYDEADICAFAQVLTQLNKHEHANQIWLTHYREQHLAQ
ncbi:heme biosynthesis HemY N-terminal domain-containing protein [Thalassotalea fusca]